MSMGEAELHVRVKRHGLIAEVEGWSGSSFLRVGWLHHAGELFAASVEKSRAPLLVGPSLSSHAVDTAAVSLRVLLVPAPAPPFPCSSPAFASPFDAPSSVDTAARAPEFIQSCPGVYSAEEDGITSQAPSAPCQGFLAVGGVASWRRRNSRAVASLPARGLNSEGFHERW